MARFKIVTQHDTTKLRGQEAYVQFWGDIQYRILWDHDDQTVIKYELQYHTSITEKQYTIGQRKAKKQLVPHGSGMAFKIKAIWFRRDQLIDNQCI